MLPPGHDPDSLIKERGAPAFQHQLDKAATLPEYIHEICTKGFPPTPCLEDKALYLQRLEPFITMACGFLQDRLVDRAHAFTGLSKNHIFADKVCREENESVARWHPLVALAARWMVFDDDPVRVATRLAKLPAHGHGLRELSELAGQIVEGKPVTGLMNQFCQAHGPLLDEEFTSLSKDWSRWHKNVLLEYHLEALSKMPFDQAAKEGIRATTRAMRAY